FMHTDRGSTKNPDAGAVIHYHLAKKPTGPLKLEILDAKGQVLVTYTGADDKEKEKEEEKDKADEDAPDGPDVKQPKRLIPLEPGVIHQFTWNLGLPGGAIIPKAKVDAGNPVEGFLAPPGQYAARLTVDGKSQTVKFAV